MFHYLNLTILREYINDTEDCGQFTDNIHKYLMNDIFFNGKYIIIIINKNQIFAQDEQRHVKEGLQNKFFSRFEILRLKIEEEG
jgi:hypothetical protein